MNEDPLKTILKLLRQVDYKELFLISSKLNEHIYTRGVEDYIRNKIIFETTNEIKLHEFTDFNNE